MDRRRAIASIRPSPAKGRKPLLTGVRLILLIEQLLHSPAQELHLIVGRPAATTDSQVDLKLGTLRQGQVTIESLGDEPRHFFAGNTHFLNQLMSRHSRNAIRAR